MVTLLLRKSWLGRQDSNLRMPVPKTGALPLGDAPAGVPADAGERRLYRPSPELEGEMGCGKGPRYSHVMTSAIALLRGINVGGHRLVPMADLRAVAQSIGLADPKTYVASGNLMFRTDKSPATAGTQLERAIEKRFGFAVDVIVRTR